MNLCGEAKVWVGQSKCCGGLGPRVVGCGVLTALGDTSDYCSGQSERVRSKSESLTPASATLLHCVLLVACELMPGLDQEKLSLI